MDLPSFSIIIPTHGRDAALNDCISALKKLDYPPELYEIIVVYDGGRPDQLPELETRVERIFSRPQRGPAAARNLGASQAAGEYLAFTDDDCTPAADWLLQFSAVFRKFPDRMAGGKIINALPQNPYSTASQLLVDFLYERYNHNLLQAQFFTTNNMALRRELFTKLEGFDTRFPNAAGEDRDFCRRWLNSGFKMVYEPAVIVYHAHKLTLAEFWRQHLHYGRGAYRYRDLHRENKKINVEPLSFYVNLLRFPLRQKNGRAKLFALFILMQFANAAGFLQKNSP